MTYSHKEWCIGYSDEAQNTMDGQANQDEKGEREKAGTLTVSITKNIDSRINYIGNIDCL